MNEDDVYTYQYPNDLEAPPTLLNWSIRDMTIIVIGGLISLSTFLNLRTFVPAAATLTYAILTMNLGGGDYINLMSYIINMLYYLTSPNEWEYKPLDSRQKEQKTKVKKKEKSTSSKSRDKTMSASARRKKELKQIEELEDSSPKTFSEIVAKNIPAIVLLVILVGGAGYFFLSKFLETHNIYFDSIIPTITNKSVEDTMGITFAESSEIEWYTGSVDPLEYATSESGTLTAEPELIDSTVIGPVTVTYTVIDADGNRKTFDHEFEVVDNEAPVIAFASDKVTLSVGDSFDPNANIDSVKDRVEGDLTYSDTADFGKYTVTSNVDTTVSGTYSVEVSAIDANGNEIKGSYSVVVSE